jgi:hypothetical protein
MMRATAIPFVGRAAPARIPSITQLSRALMQMLLAALDRLAPPRAPGGDAEPPPEYYRFPPF